MYSQNYDQHRSRNCEDVFKIWFFCHYHPLLFIINLTNNCPGPPKFAHSLNSHIYTALCLSLVLSSRFVLFKSVLVLLLVHSRFFSAESWSLSFLNGFNSCIHCYVPRCEIYLESILVALSLLIFLIYFLACFPFHAFWISKSACFWLAAHFGLRLWMVDCVYNFKKRPCHLFHKPRLEQIISLEKCFSLSLRPVRKADLFPFFSLSSLDFIPLSLSNTLSNPN